MTPPTTWEVDARVLEPGDRFKPFHDDPLWFEVVRTRQGHFWIMTIWEPATEILYASPWLVHHPLRYFTVEHGAKVVVPVLPKSI